MDELEQREYAASGTNERTPDEIPGRTVLPEELDLPPEYCRYRDEGCRLATSCLRCPFPYCVQEEWGGGQRWVKRHRALEMARLHATEHMTVRSLAVIFGVSPRTVQRELKKVRESGRGSRQSAPTTTGGDTDGNGLSPVGTEPQGQ